MYVNGIVTVFQFNHSLAKKNHPNKQTKHQQQQQQQQPSCGCDCGELSFANKSVCNFGTVRIVPKLKKYLTKIYIIVLINQTKKVSDDPQGVSCFSDPYTYRCSVPYASKKNPDGIIGHFSSLIAV